MAILITGGLGYIGSHLALNLLENNYEVVILDNLSKSDISVYHNLKQLSPNNRPYFYRGDISDLKILKSILLYHNIETVFHLAGYKSVKESFKRQEIYYDNNVNKSIILIEYLVDRGIKNFIFSSTATVYAPSEEILTENSPIGPISTYGATKYMTEQFLEKLYQKHLDLNITILRYFNPIGEHPSGLLKDTGEDNLYPNIRKCIANNTALSVYGNDYPTPDGTCIRDYINIEKLIEHHALFIKKQGFDIFNVGTGIGKSVLEIIAEFPDLKYNIEPRRSGDVSSLVCSTGKLQEYQWSI